MKFLPCILLLILGMLIPITLKAQPPSQGRPTQIRADLNTIFARGEFRTEEARSNNPLVRAWKWVKEKWNAFWEGVRKLFSSAGVSIGAMGLQWIFIILFLILAARILAKILQDYRGHRAEQKAGKRSVFEFDEADAETITDPEVWLQQAEQYAKAQDYRRAYRALFIATLLQMDRAGVIHFDRAHTNGDYLRLLRADKRQEIARQFTPLVLEFDQRWYGGLNTEESDFRRFQAAYASLQDMLQSSVMGTSLPEPVVGKA